MICKRTWIGMKLGLWSVAVLMSSLSWAGMSTQVEPCPMSGGGGHDVPTPFSCGGKYELADGEYYVVEGTVVFLPDSRDSTIEKPYLFINLNAMPWLAHSKRRVFPYYPLEGANSKWQSVEGYAVRFVAKARTHIKRGENGYEQVISLRPDGKIYRK